MLPASLPSAINTKAYSEADHRARYQTRMDNVPLSVLGDIVSRLAAMPAACRYPLHQGKSWFAEHVEIDEGSAEALGFPLEHDGPPQGAEALVDAAVEVLSMQLGRAVSRDAVQVTNGITHGLNLAFGSVLAPGDSVLMLSPQWLFARGIAAAAGARGIEVPYFTTDRPASPEKIWALLETYREPALTRAIYFNTPNNPTGLALSRWEIQALGDYATLHGLTLIADNAYEAFHFAPDGFTDPAAADLFPDITFALYSMSKTYGWTGYRIGYMLAPSRFARTVRVLALHSIYCVSTAAQYAALQGLQRREEVIARHRPLVERNLACLRRLCSVPFLDPVGGFYSMLDVRKYRGGAQAFLRAAIAKGVSLAPGDAFGAYGNRWVRLCFAVLAEDRLTAALGRLNEVYEAAEHDLDAIR